MRTRAQAADLPALDVPYLSTTFGVDEDDIQVIIDAPDADKVNAFLRSISDKASEYDALKAEKLRVEVELENTVRTSETKIKAQKTAVSRHSKEVEELRTKLNESESAREGLASELNGLKSSTSDSTAETQSLRRRIETLEAANRDTLSLVESKATEKDRLASELSEQHSKLLALRRATGQVEERNQSLENAASTQQFKEQRLQQEIELLKKSNEWHSNELQTRGQEHAKFRKERNARVASLQRELEESNATVETLKHTETTLRQRLEELQTKTDDAFAKNANLQEEFARREQDYRTQLDSTKRLAELHAQNAATHKARLQDVQALVERTRDDAAEEISKLQIEVETERADKEQAERKVADLELQVERLEHQPRASLPGTPARNGGLDPATPGRPGSPLLPGSVQKIARNLSHTQLYSQYVDAKQGLEREERRTSKLQTALDELIQEMESRAPELVEMKQEQDRLEAEILGFSRMLDESNEHRDAAVNESMKWHREVDAAARESTILRQQLRDVSAQVKMLLVELQSKDQGLGDMSAQERLELERAARGDLDDQALESLSSTQRLISDRLVIFRGVADLQARNEQLLRLTRELGDKMEGDEAREKARRSAADAVEVGELRQQIERYKDELRATATQIDSYMKERDMFRRMLQHRGTLAPDTDMQAMFGSSLMPATPQRNGIEPPTPRSKDVEDLNKILKEQQAFFDQYRNESSTDRRMLKDQVDALAREKSGLQADIARAQSQLTLSIERFEMLQSNFSALRNENAELQKRSQILAENAARQDLRTQQVAEELVEARSMAESLRNENANSKAERELWKRVESRFSHDNRALMDERSRLNKLVADLQNLINERELSEGESRRRLQGRVESLEGELAETKRRLDAEVDDGKKATLRKEYEESQSRTRIDDLVRSLGNVREELIAAKTSRDQLQGRVDEMKIELRAAEERVSALQPRPTPRNEPQSEQQVNGNGDELPAEQRLALEATELRRELDLARAELASVHEQVEQYKSIAQSTEEELANFNETSEQYREETDKLVAEKDGRVKELEQRIEDLTAELTSSDTELSDLRTKHDDSSRVLNEQKAGFEAELTRLRDDANRHAEEKRLYQDDLKAQAEIAQQAQQSYEDELLKHAEAARTLQSVRKEHHDLRTEVAGIRAEAEAAKVSLERGAESWNEQKDRLERETEELKRRRDDADTQNRLLHQQMETFSSELQALRQGRTLPAGPSEGEEANALANGDSNLQEVINFLRREKEIVDVQYELSIQEAKRLQQQLDYSNSQLEDVRQKLAEERRQSSDRAANEGSTNRLAQTINELNLFRESSVTLRNEARLAREKLDERSHEVERLIAEIDPLKARLGELEADLESKDGEIQLVTDDRNHWRERTHNIISKYDRIDPAELEELRKRIEALEAEKLQLVAEQAPLKEQVEKFDARLAASQEEIRNNLTERLEKFKDQAKDQNRKQNTRLAESKAANDAAQAEQTRLNVELERAKQELDDVRREREEAVSKAVSAQSGEGNGEPNVTSGEDHAALHGRISEAEARASEHASRGDALQARVNELEAQIAALTSQLEAAKAAARDDGEEQGEILEPATNSEVLEQLRQELTTAQQEVERLRTIGQTVTKEDHAMTEAEPGTSVNVAAEVLRQRAEMEQQHQLAIKQVEERAEQKINGLKNNLQRQLREERDRIRGEVRAELVAEHSTELQKIRDEHEATVQKLKEQHSIEMRKLTEGGAQAVQQAQAKDGPQMKTEAAASSGEPGALQITDEQATELLKNNQRLRTIFNNNVKKQLSKETERLTESIAVKDAEIARLKGAQESASSDEEKEGLKKKLQEAEMEKERLKQKVDSAQKDKETAVRQAIDNAEKKTRVQLSQRDMAQAKLAVVQKAAQETPEKYVAEVWEDAKKAKPVPKPTGAAPSAAAATRPAPPTQAQLTLQAPGTEGLQNDQAKLQARQERFGIAHASASPPPRRPTGGSFGQPSGIAGNQTIAASSVAPSFGQPSQTLPPNPFAFNAPNPQAPPFTPGPGVQQNQGTAPAALRGLSSNIPQPGGSRLPRGGGNTGRGGNAQTGIPFQGAAVGQQGRGGAQSGLPRGGGQPGRGGRGRGGGGPSVGAAAGTKRQHEGGEDGDGKRARSDGPSA